MRKQIMKGNDSSFSCVLLIRSIYDYCISRKSNESIFFFQIYRCEIKKKNESGWTGKKKDHRNEVWNRTQIVIVSSGRPSVRHRMRIVAVAICTQQTRLCQTTRCWTGILSKNTWIIETRWIINYCCTLFKRIPDITPIGTTGEVGSSSTPTIGRKNNSSSSSDSLDSAEENEEQGKAPVKKMRKNTKRNSTKTGHQNFPGWKWSRIRHSVKRVLKLLVEEKRIWKGTMAQVLINRGSRPLKKPSRYRIYWEMNNDRSTTRLRNSRWRCSFTSTTYHFSWWITCQNLSLLFVQIPRWQKA